jgi:uncharacterized protein YegP (UPF0339 family)
MIAAHLTRRRPRRSLPIRKKEGKMPHIFEITKDKKGEFRVRFKYNGEVMLSSEGYSSKASATSAIASVKKNAPDAAVEDNSGGD